MLGWNGILLRDRGSRGDNSPQSPDSAGGEEGDAERRGHGSRFGTGRGGDRFVERDLRGCDHGCRREIPNDDSRTEKYRVTVLVCGNGNAGGEGGGRRSDAACGDEGEGGRAGRGDHHGIRADDKEPFDGFDGLDRGGGVHEQTDSHSGYVAAGTGCRGKCDGCFGTAWGVGQGENPGNEHA